MSLRVLLRRQSAVAALAAAAAFFSSGNAHAGELPRSRPANGDQVILVLPAGIAGRAATPAPDADAVAAQAEKLLALARSTRDARYLGRADALIAPWVDNATATPRLFIAAAELAQQRHDFQGARKLLDRAIAGNPRDAGARLKRANAALIAGDHAAAHRDCLAVLAAGATVPGTICLASAMTGPGSVTRARRLLESLDAAGAASPAIASWLLATEVDLSLRDGDLPAALAQLAQALAVAPASEELRARVADLKLDAGDFGDALAATDGNGLSAALLVRRVRAAAAIDAGLARAARRQLDALLLVARRRGTGRHLREEAELALHVDRQASRAVELARLNFEQQKDTPDLRIFADAAIAAGDRQAIAYLRAWLAATGFEDTVVAAKLAQAGA